MKKNIFSVLLIAGLFSAILFAGCELGGLVEIPEYTVVYNSNGGTGSMTDSAFVYGAYKSLSANQFTHATLDFAGWADSPAADVQYSDKQRVKNLTETKGGKVTLYAQWGYTLSYDGNGATSGNPPASETVKPGKTVVVKGPESLRKEGETFIRWDTASGGTGTSYAAGNSVTMSGNVKFFAQWDEMIPVDVSDKASSQSIGVQLNWVADNVESDKLYVLTTNVPNEDIDSRTLSYTGKSNIIIRLKGTGGERILTLAASGPMFTVGSGVTLSLYENITLKGRGTENTENSLVIVRSGGTLVMKADSGITDNRYVHTGLPVTASYGGGVYVSDGASFTMEGGTISGHRLGGTGPTSDSPGSGGGVYVASGAQFTMSGGIISGNRINHIASANGGGVYIAAGANFNMSGGTISDNTAISGGGVFVSGTDAEFSMSGGTISENSAGGGTSGGIYGGGVYVGTGASFSMSGTAEISNNLCRTQFSGFCRGGGVYFTGVVFSKTGGTITGYKSSTVDGNRVMHADIGMVGGDPLPDTPIDNSGHAVYATGSGVTRRQEGTAGPSVNLSFNGSTGAYSGGWDNL